MNIRGLLLVSNKTKTNYLEYLANDESLYMLCLTESWLISKVLDAEILINGFKSYRADRTETTHGGVIIYMKSEVLCNELYAQSIGLVEALV